MGIIKTNPGDSIFAKLLNPILMKFITILYYYSYAFYKKVDDEPHSMTIFALSFCESLLINFIAQLVTAHFFCYSFSTWGMLGVMIAFLILNYFLFIRTGRGKRIVKSTPPVIYSNRIAKVIVILFFVVTISSLIYGPIVLKDLIENCK